MSRKYHLETELARKTGGRCEYDTSPGKCPLRRGRARDIGGSLCDQGAGAYPKGNALQQCDDVSVSRYMCGMYGMYGMYGMGVWMLCPWAE